MKNLFTIFIFTILCIKYSNGQPIERIDEGLLRCIVNIDGKGTGFLVAKVHPVDTSKIKLCLVTNKHMIGNWNMVDEFIPNYSITSYLYSKIDSQIITPIKIPLRDNKGNLLSTVKVHKNPKIDIAVIDITPQISIEKDLDLAYFDTSFLIPIDKINKETSNGIGSQVFAIGYPAGITSVNSRKPIVKFGYISSSLSGDLIIYSNWKNRKGKIISASPEGKFFLVDGLIIGGNSGGPIVVPAELQYSHNKNTGSVDSREVQNLIIGIVSFNLNETGISVIYSSDHILEVLDDIK